MTTEQNRLEGVQKSGEYVCVDWMGDLDLGDAV